MGKFWYFQNKLHRDLMNVFRVQLFVFTDGEVNDTFRVIREVKSNGLRHRYEDNVISGRLAQVGPSVL